jgi:hypothetical protein
VVLTVSRFLLSKSINGFVLHCQARRLSPNIINDYSGTLRQLKRYLGDVSVADISKIDLRKLLADQDVSKKRFITITSDYQFSSNGVCLKN